MEFLLSLIFLLSILAFFIFLVWLIVALIAKKKKMISLVGMAVSFMLFVITFILIPSNENSQTQEDADQENEKVSETYYSPSSDDNIAETPVQNEIEEILDGNIDNDNVPEQETDSDVLEEQSGLFDEEKVISQLDVTEFHYNDIWDYDFLVVKNNSEFNLDLSVDVLYYDEYNKIIGVTSREESAVESGYPVLFWFMPDDEYARVEYTFSAEEEDLYEPVISDLSYEESVTDSKVILSVTNNGSEPADFVEGSVIFFSSGNPVGFDTTYFTDDESELKPGKTIIKEFNCYDSFDSYEVYFTGRRGGFF